jgi:hypothetical protein
LLIASGPPEFTINRLRGIASAALGYDVGATNLQRVMTQRQMIEPTGNQSTSPRERISAAWTRAYNAGA